ncbi:MAG: Gfo/Idh/MocA family oxidoreductase [Candidatus Bathyarchaeia archaeon]
MSKDTLPLLRIGVIGCGRVLNHAHLPAIVEVPGIAVTGFYDSNRVAAENTLIHYKTLVDEKIQFLRSGSEYLGGQRAADRLTASARIAQLQEALGEAKVYASAESLVSEVDVVTICTPVLWHVPYAKMAVEHGVHAMSEKPMGRTWWEAYVLRDAVKKSGRLYQLCDDNVFIPRYQALRNVVESGLIGEVQSLWMTRGSHGGEVGWFWDPFLSGGGCLMDYGTHAVTAAWFLLGFDKKPVRVKSTGIRKRQPTRSIEGRLQTVHVEDDAHFKICFEDPKNRDLIVANIEATWSWAELGTPSNGPRGYILVEGSEGTVTGLVDEANDIDYLKIVRYGYGERLIRVPTVKPEKESVEGEIRNFVECVHQGVPSILNEDVGLGVMEILGSAYLSEVRGRVAVSPDEFREFCEEIGSRSSSYLEAGEVIVSALMKPYR